MSDPDPDPLIPFLAPATEPTPTRSAPTTASHGRQTPDPRPPTPELCTHGSQSSAHPRFSAFRAAFAGARSPPSPTSASVADELRVDEEPVILKGVAGGDGEDGAEVDGSAEMEPGPDPTTQPPRPLHEEIPTGLTEGTEESAAVPASPSGVGSPGAGLEDVVLVEDVYDDEEEEEMEEGEFAAHASVSAAGCAVRGVRRPSPLPRPPLQLTCESRRSACSLSPNAAPFHPGLLRGALQGAVLGRRGAGHGLL